MSEGASSGSAVVLYFCTTEQEKVVGTGSAGWFQYRKENPKTKEKLTPFDCPPVLKAFKDAGITKFVKVSAAQENKDLWLKYQASINSMVIVAPDGKKLAAYAGSQFTQNPVTKGLTNFKRDFEAYKKLQSKKDTKSSKNTVVSGNDDA